MWMSEWCWQVSRRVVGESEWIEINYDSKMQLNGTGPSTKFLFIFQILLTQIIFLC